MNDIDLTEATAEGGDWDFMGNGWNPIGSNNRYEDGVFSGIFDGGGHTIKGMRIEISNWPAFGYRTKAIYLGLFSRVSGEVRNLHLEGGKIETITVSSYDLYAGGIAGESTAVIDGCSASLYLNVDWKENIYVGGIVGSSSGAIWDCWNGGAIRVTASHDVYAGGIAGNGKREYHKML